jgi:Putative beta-barrel porin 2
VTPTKYTNFTKFDHVGFLGDVNWDWELSGPLSGQVGFRASQALLGFYAAATTVTDKNLVTRTEPYFVGRLRITPSWRLRAGFDQAQTRNSLDTFKVGDNTATGVEGGIEFAPGTGTELSLNLRNVRGKYDNLQQVTVNGAPILGTGLDNSYKQNDLIARLRVRPSEDSLLGGYLGVSKRKYDIDGSRDFSGPIAGLEMQWRPSGAFNMNINLNKRLDLPTIFTTNHVDVTELLLRPSLVWTGKITLNGRLDYSIRKFSGDPTTNFERNDTITAIGVGAAYEYSRAFLFNVDLINENRSSNLAGANFKNTILWFQATGRF